MRLPNRWIREEGKTSRCEKVLVTIRLCNKHQPLAQHQQGEVTIQQQELNIKVGETDVAVTGIAGLSALVRIERRRRRYSSEASTLDLMLLLSAGGECIDDLEVLRGDRGLSQIIGCRVMDLRPRTSQERINVEQKHMILAEAQPSSATSREKHVTRPFCAFL